jgi:hypothetical protein
VLRGNQNQITPRYSRICKDILKLFSDPFKGTRVLCTLTRSKNKSTLKDDSTTQVKVRNFPLCS